MSLLLIISTGRIRRSTRVAEEGGWLLQVTRQSVERQRFAAQHGSVNTELDIADNPLVEPPL